MCPSCGYDMSGLPSWVCPECGAEVPTSVDIMHKRHEYAAGWHEGETTRFHRAIAVAGVYAVLTAAATRQIGNVIPAAFVLLVSMYLTALLGKMVAKGADRSDRDAVRMIWGRELWILHLPWLAWPIMLGITLLLATLKNDGYRAVQVYWWVPLVALVLLFLIAFAAWAARVSVLMQRHRIRADEKLSSRLFPAAFFALLMTTGVAGFGVMSAWDLAKAVFPGRGIWFY